MEFEFDAKNLLHVRIDRKRKFLASVFLRALGMKSDAEILKRFYKSDRILAREGRLFWKTSPNLVGLKLSKAVFGPKDASGKRDEIVHAGKKITATHLAEIQRLDVQEIEITEADLEGAFTVADIVDPRTGEVVLEGNEPLSPRVLSVVLAEGSQIDSFEVFFPERDEIQPMLSMTVKKDTIKSPEEALVEIYRRMRPGDPPTLDSSRNLFEGMFLNAQKYDFSRVGRLKLNTKLGLGTPLTEKIIHLEDIVAVIGFLLKLRRNPQDVDDIDHLGNRRVRSVGELLENQFRIGLVRMERAIKEKMSVYQEMATAMPHDLINAKPVMASIREFFGSSQLSQFMDQTNPLSEITHKRRLSALGPGGLSRERAGFEVRDVHPTHYGRICPIETPEGPNIGLISSLSCFARINEFGFIESPYRKVKDGRVLDYVQVMESGDSAYKVGDIVERDEMERENGALAGRKKKQAEIEPYCFYLSAWEEDKYTIAQANARLDARRQPDGRARRGAQDRRLDPRQARGDRLRRRLAEAARLRRRLAHPLPRARRREPRPDGLEHAAPGGAAPPLGGPPGRDRHGARHGQGLRRRGRVPPGGLGGLRGLAPGHRARRGPGRPRQGQGDRRRHLQPDEVQVLEPEHEHQPEADREGRASTWPRARSWPTAPARTWASSPSAATCSWPSCPGAGTTSRTPSWSARSWSRRTCTPRSTSRSSRSRRATPSSGPRTSPATSRTCPRGSSPTSTRAASSASAPASSRATSSWARSRPKGETQLTPEEKLLRAIFGEKAGDVRDASLYCPPGIEGIVVDVKIFSRKGVEKDDRARQIEDAELFMMEKNLKDEIRILQDERDKRIENLLEGQSATADLVNARGDKVVKKGQSLTRDVLEKLRHSDILKLRVTGDVEEALNEIVDKTERQIEVLKTLFAEKESRLKRGDELPPGVIKLVKVFVAMKRKLSVGDKMAGRHGNKGVIARILPDEDMPYLPDGTPVEIVLNPLGVPSRMNVGQILETHLGWAAKVLGLHVATPVFDGASEREIKALGEKANAREAEANPLRPNLLESGKSTLIDGMTGEPFEQKVTVGYIYMLKLSHLVDDKIHARSIGPYSLITQQPLGGKAQFGGQRFGEMEVWALEAYGAAHILQELLTAKSDDVYGRAKIYEAIVKGDTAYTPGIPESFNVLIRELQSLCLDVELIKTKH